MKKFANASHPERSVSGVEGSSHLQICKHMPLFACFQHRTAKIPPRTSFGRDDRSFERFKQYCLLHHHRNSGDLPAVRDGVKCPAWLFVTAMALYCELLLHLWTNEILQGGRILAISAFALGFGGVLGLLISLIPSRRWAKRMALLVGFLMAAFWLVEFFVQDTYNNFMFLDLMLQGAGGIAQDYLDLVVTLLSNGLWRIGLMLLPLLLYGLFGREPDRRCRTAAALLAVLGYLGGFAAVHTLTEDAPQLDRAYSFDSAVHCFGLHMGLGLELYHGNVEAEPTFLPPPTQPAEMTETTEPLPGETQGPEISYADNVMEGLDFAALAQEEKHSGVASLHRYVNSLTPSQQNAYTGLFAGKNLILITAEAFTKEVIDPELTPTLYRLANEGIRFDDYYQPAWGASTTSGEFSNLMGIVPSTGGMCMKEPMQQKMFLTMGHQLKALGYYSVAYHNHNKDFYDRNKTHLHLGYDKFLAQYGGLEGITPVWPESDLEMIDISVPQYIDQQPFSIYYMTVSGHSVYTQAGHAMAKKNYAAVADLPYSETVKCYLAAQLELEYAMASLVRQLEEAGIADDTVIVLATDHYPYGLERSGTWQNTVDYMLELFDTDSYDGFVRDHSALIIWSGCIEDLDLAVEEPVYSLDILPTLSNLFGVEYDSRLLVGRDVFSDTEPLVLWPDFSWKTDKASFDFQNKVFAVEEGITLPEGYRAYIDSLVANKINYSKSVQKLDYFNYLWKALGRE